MVLTDILLAYAAPLHCYKYSPQTDGPPGSIRSGGLINPQQYQSQPWQQPEQSYQPQHPQQPYRPQQPYQQQGQPGSFNPNPQHSDVGYGERDPDNFSAHSPRSPQSPQSPQSPLSLRSAHSPEPSFVQPTIPSDHFGSGSSLHHQQSSADVNTIRNPDSNSPQPSLLQPPTIQSYGGGSYRGGGSTDGSPRRQSGALSIASPARSTSRSPSFQDELAHLASRFMMKGRKNMAWKANGPKDVRVEWLRVRDRLIHELRWGPFLATLIS